MARLVIFYAIALALAVTGLEWLEYRYVTRAFSTEIYIVLLAAAFAGLGLWAGHRLTRRRAPPSTAFERNDAAIRSLGLTPRECEILQPAGVAYVAVWEVYLAMTDYKFMDEYIAGIVRARQAAGLSAAALAEEMAKMESMRTSYANPLFRIPMTFLEIFPVGLLVSLVSALLLRNPKLLPAAGARRRHCA